MTDADETCLSAAGSGTNGSSDHASRIDTIVMILASDMLGYESWMYVQDV